MPSEPIFLGIDAGTSGIRGSCIDLNGQEIASHSIALEMPGRQGNHHAQDPATWLRAIIKLVQYLNNRVEPKTITALAIDGTSGSVLLCDPSGHPVSPALMYNDQSASLEAEAIKHNAPADSPAQGATSSLAKTLFLMKQHQGARYICHQADWLTAQLTGRPGISDSNNCLKLGYDVINNRWPDWLSNLPGAENGLINALPEVVTPGTVIGTVSQSASRTTGLDKNCQVVAGTTDSIAGFIATGARDIGDAVTSLGSTLVLKIVSDQPVFAAEYGIYSHKLGDRWLAGGASNSGGMVLLKYFSQQQIDQMTPDLNPDRPTGLDYYPLANTGERFPVNDPGLEPRLTPRPENDIIFFQALLEGIAHIEDQGYQQLVTQGAPPPKQVLTTGGGSRNQHWNRIRQLQLNVPVCTAEHSEASYGAARLALQGYTNSL